MEEIESTISQNSAAHMMDENLNHAPSDSENQNKGDLNNAIAQLETQNENLRKTNEKLKENHEYAVIGTKHINKKTSIIDSIYEKIQAKEETITEKLNELMKSPDALNSGFQKHQDHSKQLLSKIEEQIYVKSKEVDYLEKAKNALITKMENSTLKLNEAESNYSCLKKQIADLNSSIFKLKHETSMISSSVSNRKAEKELLQNKIEFLRMKMPSTSQRSRDKPSSQNKVVKRTSQSLMSDDNFPINCCTSYNYPPSFSEDTTSHVHCLLSNPTVSFATRRFFNLESSPTISTSVDTKTHKNKINKKSNR